MALLLENKSSTLAKVYVDCTLGGGGYTKNILNTTADDISVIAIDRDPNAIEYSKKLLRSYSGRFIPVNKNFTNLKEIIKSSFKNEEDVKVSGIVLDLGL